MLVTTTTTVATFKTHYTETRSGKNKNKSQRENVCIPLTICLPEYVELHVGIHISLLLLPIYICSQVKESTLILEFKQV